MDNPFKSPTIISLCPGFLGLERGLQRAIGHIHIAAYVEIEAFIIENLLQGMQRNGIADVGVSRLVSPQPMHNRITKVDE